MRIAFATNSMQVGGIETNLVRLTRTLSQRGHSVIVISGGGSLSTAIAEAGGSNVLASFDRHDPIGLIKSTVAFRRLVMSGSLDVIAVFSANAAFALMLARVTLWRSRVELPTVVSAVMGLQLKPTESAFVTHARVWVTSLGSAVVIVISPAIQSVIRRLPISRKRLRSVPVVGIDMPRRGDPASRRQLRDWLLGSEADAVVMTIGRLDPRKSHDLFIEAAGHVVDARPRTRFIVVGDGPERDALQSRAESLGLSRNLVLAGERTDLDDLLACADVYVRPGVVEGFIGITVLQAQAARVPVVSFDTLDVRMAIQPGVTGWLADRGDARALAERILDVLSQPAAVAEVIEAAHEQAVRCFDVEAVASSLEELFREVTSPPAPGLEPART